MPSKRKSKGKRGAKRAPKVASFSAAEFRHKAFTISDQVKGLAQFMSLSELSRETGIPRTTLRRYRDGGRPKAGSVGELYAGILQSGFDVIHRESARERAKSRSVNAVGKGKRVYRVDPTDPKRKKKIASDSVDRNVMNSADRAIVTALKRAQVRANFQGIPGFVRFLVLGDETDPQYPGQYFWTEPESLADLAPDELPEIVQEARSRGTLILMRIQDREE